MNDKVTAILLQLVKGLKSAGWVVGQDWELTLKSEGHVPMVRQIVANGSLDNEKWKDEITVYIDLKLASDDEWTYFPEFTIYGQVKIGDIPSEDIAYKMQSNTSFMADALKDKESALKADKQSAHAAREINRLAESHINEVYQDYVEKNEELVRFYKQGSSE